MRIALISDLHANLLALDAVLRDLDRVGYDTLVCLGDVATLGPHPVEVVQRLRELGCACVLGNHDAFIFAPERVAEYTKAPPIVDAIDWARSQLDADAIDFLTTFEERISLPLGPHGDALLFHGSPDSNTTDVLATTPPATLDALLAGYPASVYACGHTHLQMLRQHRGALIVNPGSVGMPFLAHRDQGGPPVVLPWAEYALLDTDGSLAVSLRRIPLEKAALRAAAEGSACPLAPMLVAMYT